MEVRFDFPKLRERPLFYILDDADNPVPVDDAVEWGQWMEKNKLTRCRVAEDSDEGEAKLWTDKPTIWISTVFLGLDHQHFAGRPLLYETMVFGGPLNGEQDRYATRDEALAGHQVMCRRVSEAVNTP